MPVAEWCEWCVFMQIEPIGEHRADLRSAMACDVAARLGGNKSKASDFMPRYPWPDMAQASADDAPQDPAELRAALEAAYSTT